MDRGFVERENAVARKRVKDEEAAIMQDMTTAENECSTTEQPETKLKRC
jgi:hypothetical protein